MADDVTPGPEAGLVGEGAGPLVIRCCRQPLPHSLGEGYLQGVELGVLVVAIVANTLSPAALAALKVRVTILRAQFIDRDVIGILAGGQRSSVVALQEEPVRDAAVSSNTLGRWIGDRRCGWVPVQCLSIAAELA